MGLGFRAEVNAMVASIGSGGRSGAAAVGAMSERSTSRESVDSARNGSDKSTASHLQTPTWCCSGPTHIVYDSHLHWAMARLAPAVAGRGERSPDNLGELERKIRHVDSDSY